MAKHILISRAPFAPLASGGLARRGLRRGRLAGAVGAIVLCGPALGRFERGWDGERAEVQAQAYRFSLNAEPDIITANGISTTSISVQVPNSGSAFSASPVVRFLTSAGSIEPQARVVGGVARALLRSSTTPGTAVVTAIIGASREQVTVEFSSDEVSLARYLQVDGSYVAYNATGGTITASGKCALDYGELHIESDVRMDVDLLGERVWAQGSSGHVLIRNSKTGEVHELRGDRLFYDITRRRGVIRRIDTSAGPARQEFMDSDFRALPKAQAPLPIESASIAPSRPLQGRGASTSSQTRVASITPSTAPQTPTVAPSAAESTLQGAKQQTADTRQPQNLVLDASTSSALPIVPPLKAPALDASTQTSSSQSPLLSSEIKLPDAASSTPSSVPSSTPSSTPSMAAQVAPDGAMAGAAGAASTSGTGVQGSLPLGLGKAANGADEAPLQEVPAYSSLPEAPASAAPVSAAQPSVAQLSTTASGEATALGAAVPGTQDAAQPEPHPVQVRAVEQIVEPDPPTAIAHGGYWVTARKIRIFAHDKIQFEKASVYFNGLKLFSMPRYVAPLNGTFSPATEMMAFNSSGGLTLNVPYYYMTSAHGTGALYAQYAPHNGFAAEAPGPALTLDQQYWLSDKSQGRLTVDQIGHAWNLNWSHQHQFSPTMRGDLYLDMPRHENAFLRSTLVKDTRSAQLGFEGLLSHLRGAPGDAQGQFYARLRPRALGHSGWSYSMGANLIALRQFAIISGGGTGTGSGGTSSGGSGSGGTGSGGGGTGSGGGGIVSGRPGVVGIPGSGPRRLEAALQAEIANIDHQVRPSTMRALVEMRAAQAVATASTYKASTLLGQTLLTSLQSPQKRLWKGASLSGNVLASAFNYSDGRRGLAPGLILNFQQNLGRLGGLQIDYNFDRGGLSSIGGLYGSSSTNFASANVYLNLGQRINANAYFTRSFSDGGTYGAATLDFFPFPKWRLGLFSDYSRFDAIAAYLDYGLSLGRQVGQREVSLNWSRNRGRVYLELGGVQH